MDSTQNNLAENKSGERDSREHNGSGANGSPENGNNAAGNGSQGHHSHDEMPHNLPRLSKTKLIVMAVVVVGLFAIAFTARIIPQLRHDRELRAQADEEGKAPPIVNVTLPQPQATEQELSLPADVRPMAQTAIYARVDGYMGHWYVDIGDHVEKGQLLAQIDAPDTDAELDESRAAVLQANANAISADVNLKLANATYERYHGLLPTGGVTQQDLDTRKTAANQAAANKAAADAAVKSAQATVDRLTAQQGFEKIIAPFSGTITFRNYDNGARISASDTAIGHEMFDIADTDHLRIYINVPQTYVTLIQANQPVNFLAVRNYGERKFVGYVARSAGALDPSTRTLLTETDFDNRDHLLWAGMYGEVHIGVHHDHPILTVPTAAMLFEANGTQVAVVGPDNKVQFKKVLVGQDLGQKLEVVNGLSTNERVVTNPGEKLVEGTTVEIAGQGQNSNAAAVASTDDSRNGDAQTGSPSTAPPTTAPSANDQKVALSPPTTRFAQIDPDPTGSVGPGGAAR